MKLDKSELADPLLLPAAVVDPRRRDNTITLHFRLYYVLPFPLAVREGGKSERNLYSRDSHLFKPTRTIQPSAGAGNQIPVEDKARGKKTKR